jgi:hypothetical protein
MPPRPAAGQEGWTLIARVAEGTLDCGPETARPTIYPACGRRVRPRARSHARLTLGPPAVLLTMDSAVLLAPRLPDVGSYVTLVASRQVDSTDNLPENTLCLDAIT